LVQLQELLQELFWKKLYQTLQKNSFRGEVIVKHAL
jgi:hypothetical protein